MDDQLVIAIPQNYVLVPFIISQDSSSCFYQVANPWANCVLWWQTSHSFFMPFLFNDFMSKHNHFNDVIFIFGPLKFLFPFSQKKEKNVNPPIISINKQWIEIEELLFSLIAVLLFLFLFFLLNITECLPEILPSHVTPPKCTPVFLFNVTLFCTGINHFINKGEETFLKQNFTTIN